VESLGYVRSPEGVRQRLVLEWLLIAVLVTLTVTVLSLTGNLRRQDNIAYDQLQRDAHRASDPSILLVEIDDRSVAELGAWPWSRRLHAQLIDRLAAAGPKAIVYDLLFAEPSPEPGADQVLTASIRAAGNVYLPLAEVGGPQRKAAPVNEIAAAAAGLGLVSVHTDSDGLVRRMFPFELRDGRLTPDLMSVVDHATRPAAGGAPAGGSPTPLLIPFTNPPGAFRTVAFSSVLRGEVPAELLRDKTVFVGVAATGVGERFSTPTTGGRSTLPGIELQANILQGLRLGAMLHPASVATSVAFSILPIWLMLLAFWLLPPHWHLPVGFVLALLVLIVSAAAFGLWRVWLSPVEALVGLLILSPLLGWRRLVTISDYLGLELRRLGLSAGLAPADRSTAGGDVITRQALSLGVAISKIDGMRRFAADALFSLPDATLVVDAGARVIAANGAAQALFNGAGHWVVEGHKAGAAMNALNALGRRFADDWPIGEAAGEAVALELSDGRSFELQIVERQNGDGQRAAWIIRLADVSAMKAAIRQKEQVIQLLTHDLRSPQISILAVIEAAGAGDIDAALGERIAAYSRRTLDLADGFVHLARAEETLAGRDVIDICDVANEAVDELWPQSRKRGVEIRQSNCDSPRYVEGDRQILTRALINLIGNAIKYGPEQSVIEVYVFSRVAAGRPMVGVAVKDQGLGLTQEEAATAFEPFRRFERAQPTDGVGLGLAFVRAAAARHGGLASCHSAPGQGATFTLELPEHLENRSPDSGSGG
jgi:CHASE2 domain-containing sensor protein/nitrogen-specific signal transduction histidine kinase